MLKHKIKLKVFFMATLLIVTHPWSLLWWACLHITAITARLYHF